MELKQIDVTCPCCNTRLTVDVLTRKVLRHAPPGQIDDTGKAVLDEGRWDDASARVKGRQAASQDKFESSLGRERTREGDLDDLFERAKRKVKDRTERLEEEED